MRRGRLIYLAGASGAGKDSLIDALRVELAARDIDVVRRVITRSAEASGEQAVGVTHEAFEQMVAQGRFALSWHANGLRYGIPVEVDRALAEGRWVLMNGSRGYLPQALDRYPDALPILVTVNKAVLRERLVARGRETAAEIEARLLRSEQLHQAPGAWQGTVPGLHVVDNSTTLEQAATTLLALIDQARFNAAEG
jgi:ribose 1,5-bisphosphokinase